MAPKELGVVVCCGMEGGEADRDNEARERAAVVGGSLFGGQESGKVG